MMIPLHERNVASGVSLGCTSAYTPSSRTRRAIKCVYCPPVSRTVIWGCRLELVNASSLFFKACFGLCKKRCGLRHGLDGLLYLRILLHAHALRILVAECRHVHLSPKLIAYPLMVFRPIRFAEFYALLHQVIVEFLKHGFIRYPALRKLRIVVRKILCRKSEKCVLPRDA